jgi:hypothetical protein
MCRHAENRFPGGNVPQHNAAGADAGEGSHVPARQHDRVRAHENGLFDDDGSGDIGVTIERRERTDARVVPYGYLQIQMDVIADGDVGRQCGMRAQNRTDADLAVGADDGRGVNNGGELCASLELVDNLHLDAWLANRDEHPVLRFKTVRIDIPYDAQIAGKVAQRVGSVVEKANQVEVASGLTEIPGPGGDFAAEASGSGNIKAFLFHRITLVGRIAPVDRQATTRDPAGRIGQQEGDGTGHVGRLAQTQRMHLFDGAYLVCG